MAFPREWLQDAVHRTYRGAFSQHSNTLLSSVKLDSSSSAIWCRIAVTVIHRLLWFCWSGPQVAGYNQSSMGRLARPVTNGLMSTEPVSVQRRRGAHYRINSIYPSATLQHWLWLLRSLLK